MNIKNVILTVVSLLICLAVSEVVLRSLGIFKTWGESSRGVYSSPNATWPITTPWLMLRTPYSEAQLHSVDFDISIKTNREGLRDVDHEIQKPADTFRIVFLGDSFAEGIGVPFEESPGFLMQKMIQNKKCKKKIEFILGGRGATDPVTSYFTLKLRLLKYRPNLVVLLTNESDYYDVLRFGGFDRFDQNGFFKPIKSNVLLEKIYQHSHLARGIMTRILRYDSYLLTSSERQERSKKVYQIFDETFREYKKLEEQEGFQFLVAYHPSYFEFKNSVPSPQFLKIEPILKQIGIPFVNLTPFFRAKILISELKNYFFPVDQHFNSGGYKLLAGSTIQTLTTNYLSEICDQ